MKTPLVPVNIISIYTNAQGHRQPLPVRMAKCTPDTLKAIHQIAAEVAKKKGTLVLSDLFRSYDMQAQSHSDYLSGKKKAYSPPPGGSFHEAGRAFDIDLKAIGMPLQQFWTIAAKYNVRPIIAKPNAGAKEAWHFDCRGSHQLVNDYYAAGKGNNFKPYAAAAASTILSVGVWVDAFNYNQSAAALQSCLIRLGKVIGNMDGHIGRKTQKAVEELGIAFQPHDVAAMLLQAENLVQERFEGEFVVEE